MSQYAAGTLYVPEDWCSEAALDVLGWRDPTLRFLSACLSTVLDSATSPGVLPSSRGHVLESLALGAGLPGSGTRLLDKLLSEPRSGYWRDLVSQVADSADRDRVRLAVIEIGLTLLDREDDLDGQFMDRGQRRFDTIVDELDFDLGFESLASAYEIEVEQLAEAKLSMVDKVLWRGLGAAGGAVLGLLTMRPSDGKHAGKWVRSQMDKIASTDFGVRSVAALTLSYSYLRNESDQVSRTDFLLAEGHLAKKKKKVDAEIARRAAVDPDAPMLTEWSRHSRVLIQGNEWIRELRHSRS